MSLPEVVSPEQWLAARLHLLEQEKEMTRRRDSLNADRRRMPMVAVGKDYAFEGPAGPAGLLEMFDGCSQLVLQHVMFGPDWQDACPACSAWLDEMGPGVLAHLRSRDTAFAGVSRAPRAKLASCQERKGWQFPWYSSFGSDFNYDFHVTLDEAVAPVEFNYRTRAEYEQAGLDDGSLGKQSTELSGTSCFVRDGDSVFHTYSTFARGLDQVGSAYTLLDLTAFGRSENWEEPKGRVGHPHGPDPSFGGFGD